MRRLVIEGGRKLSGAIRVSGAKNESLPVLALSLLADDELTLENVPLIKDVFVQVEILKSLGCKAIFLEKGKLSVSAADLSSCEVPIELAAASRGSVLFMGALLGRLGKVCIGLPGGDNLGLRPIDLHLKGFRAMGARIEVKDRCLKLTANKLRGADIFLDRPSTTATENLLIAGSLAEGVTTIQNAERTPEIISLIGLLKKMGVKIQIETSGAIRIKGVAKLSGTNHRLIPDPFETGTYMAASAITGGDVLIENGIYEHCIPTIAKLSEAGARISRERGGVRVIGTNSIKPVNVYASAPFPAFQSDMQPILAALMTIAKGSCTVTDSVFRDRFNYVGELRKLGAKIDVQGNTATIQGVEKLIGVHVEAKDIRCGGALVLAGLSAEGVTDVASVDHIDRAYEEIEKKLSVLGASIRRR